MLNATLGDAIGPVVIVLLLAGTAMFAAWLLLMRLVVARQIRGGTMAPEAGIAVLRRLNSGVLVLAVGCAFFTAPFSPMPTPNSHAAVIATAIIDAFALIVYAYITVAVRRLGEKTTP
jgi:hypothetical protein